MEQSVVSFDIRERRRSEPAECWSNQMNRRGCSYPNWKVNPPGKEPLVKLNWLPPGSAKNAWNTLLGSMSPGGKKKSGMYSLFLSNMEKMTPNYKVYDIRTSTYYTNNICSVNAGCHAHILHILCSAYLILILVILSTFHRPTAIHSESYKGF